ncbi:MAG: DNA repair protein RecN [Eubacteriaceae bacterium]|nr:DNA repair protein RecN [Eubacteriaceae bacterium]
MIRTLYVKDFALIEDVTVEFSKGLNVLTGETGAGKSIIIDALSLLMGGRSSKKDIAYGQNKAVIQGQFELQNDRIRKDLSETYGIDPNSQDLILSREINRSGRNVCKINGFLITVGELKQISQLLVSIYAQNQFVVLQDKAYYRDIIDGYGGKELDSSLEKIKNLTDQMKRLRKTIQQSKKDYAETLKQKEFLNHQYKEIIQAQLNPQEEETLTAEKIKIQNKELLAEKLYQSIGLLQSQNAEIDRSGIVEDLYKLKELVYELSSYDENYKSYDALLESMIGDLDELSRIIGSDLQNLDYQQSSLDGIQARLSLIATLKRKYNMDVEEMLDYASQLSEKLVQFENYDSNLKKLMGEYQELWQTYLKEDQVLHRQRIKVATDFSEKFLNELKDLALEKAVFKVDIQRKENTISKYGQDVFDFLFSANPGVPVKSLNEVASGGELSRMMLAFKKIYGTYLEVPIMVFDEVDTGISGRTAQAVAEKLNDISRAHQVLCVSHLPQIAAMADRHILVEKKSTQNQTKVNFKKLLIEERAEELARMLGGAYLTEKGYELARELLSQKESRQSTGEIIE